MKKVPADNKGLAKLPKKVRNKMGYFKDGGTPTKKKMHTKQKAGFSLASSPRFKTIAAKVEKGELTTAEALDMLIPENLKGEERKKARKKLAQAIGSQNSEAYVTKSRQRINEELRRKGGDYEKKQSRKPGFAKGGAVPKFKTCKGCTSPSNCSANKKCQNAGK